MSVAPPARAEDSVSIDIYAIPSQPVVDAVAKASDDLAKLGMTSFHAQGHAVHVTLYLTRYPADAEPHLKAAVANVAKDCKSFPLFVEGTERTPSNWLFLQVKRTAALQRLADLVTLAAEPFRDHDVSPPGWMSAYPAKLPAFERYGSPNVFMQFEPHLTLLAEETNPALATFVASMGKDLPQATGKVEGIGIGLVNSKGQVVKTLAEFPCADHP
ncbi:2'-5' RNA ligase family protein [Novosphingobium sp. BL-8A]|uniref:2'-5' RNA ligase family protein n=1 Tax=Novosphingobium sp. BL-8A TaxID=3127639 RepID=UPI003756FA31